eukprot:1179573-Prorocentrum_minimum.AAC.1
MDAPLWLPTPHLLGREFAPSGCEYAPLHRPPPLPDGAVHITGAVFGGVPSSSGASTMEQPSFIRGGQREDRTQGRCVACAWCLLREFRIKTWFGGTEPGRAPQTAVLAQSLHRGDPILTSVTRDHDQICQRVHPVD